MRPLRPLLALSAVALLGACGTDTGANGSGASGAATPPASTSTSSTTATDPENPTLPSDGRGKLVTVTGTVSAGVENGCLLLTTRPASPDGPWQLVGNIAGIEPGQKVTVRGARVDTVATTCQQGLPFDVQAVVKS
jgi:hypothetical protein